MTREEAIAYFEARRNYNPHDGNPEAERLAISALRAQQKLESNQPLTMDDLRRMDGEPVWVVVLDFSAEWRILECVDTRSQEKTVLFRDGSHEPLTEYGKEWLAYRHKLETHTYTCTATNQPCAMCQPGPCGSRREDRYGSD